MKQVGSWASCQRFCHVGLLLSSCPHSMRGKEAPQVQQAISWCLIFTVDAAWSLKMDYVGWFSLVKAAYVV